MRVSSPRQLITERAGADDLLLLGLGQCLTLQRDIHLILDLYEARMLALSWRRELQHLPSFDARTYRLQLLPERIVGFLILLHFFQQLFLPLLFLDIRLRGTPHAVQLDASLC